MAAHAKDVENVQSQRLRMNKMMGSIVDAGFLLLALLLSVAYLATAQEPALHPDYVVAKPVMDMFAHPDAQSEVVSQAIYGSGVQTLEKKGDWYHIRTVDNYTGWINAADVRALKGGTYAPEGHALRVVALSANVYREPDVTRRAAVLQLPWEARLELTHDTVDQKARWIEVRLVDGQTAWVQQGDVSQQFSAVDIAEMLKLAHRFLGITYTWGGVSSFGYDCSGFTQMLERQRGVIMPRDAGIQASWSGVVAVERKDLQAGDLLFFGSSATKITHTGMYLGNGEFIHDTTHGHPGVQISRLDDAPWTTLLVAARRTKQ